jgi:hypothetical protein
MCGDLCEHKSQKREGYLCYKQSSSDLKARHSRKKQASLCSDPEFILFHLASASKQSLLLLILILHLNTSFK